MTISRDGIIDCLEAMAKAMADNKDLLTELDAATGDADHGINMARGFGSVMAKLPGVRDKDIGTVLKTVGMALVSTVGGAAGPLYGTFFLRMSIGATGKLELTGGDLLGMLEAGVKGVADLGKTKPGEKTMVDALQPAVDALREALARGSNVGQAGCVLASRPPSRAGRTVDVGEALQQAAAAAEAGMKATIPMKALKGRASYLGERSIGHQDPGATSSFLLLKAMSETLAGSAVRPSG